MLRCNKYFLTSGENGLEWLLCSAAKVCSPIPRKGNQMFKIDQFSAANEAAINQFTYFAQLSLANVERFAELSLGAARDSVEQVAAHAQSLAGAKDVHEVIALNSAALEPV